jgi:hypothetical protein
MLIILGPLSLAVAQTGSGFRALDNSNYSKAKRIFKRNVRSNPVLGHYGMALFFTDAYSRFHSFDSAYFHINRSLMHLPYSNILQRRKLKKNNLDRAFLEAQKDFIYRKAFEEAAQKGDWIALDRFVTNFPYGTYTDSACSLRDSYFFKEAENEYHSRVWAQFVLRFPRSVLRVKAQANLEKTRYLEVLNGGALSALVDYINDFPNSAYRGDAEDDVFRMMTFNNTQESLYDFALKYPNNRNNAKAWDMLYRLYTADQRSESFESFKKKYPEYPFKEQISEDAELAKIKLFPVVKNQLWGFADSLGVIRIPFQFDEVDLFYENLAVVTMNGLKGYINKAGLTVIQAQFKFAEAFSGGRAIVETDSASGVINSSGAWIIKPEFSSISGPFDGIFRVEKNEFYGLIDRSGKLLTEIVYDEIEPFYEGLAAVARGGLTGFVDSTGKESIALQFEEVNNFISGVARVKKVEKYGLINHNGTLLIAPEHRRISLPSEQLMLVSNDDECGYYNLVGKKEISLAEGCPTSDLNNHNFSCGLARLSKKGKYGFINKKGKWAISAQFDDVSQFSEGCAGFKEMGKWGLIDKNGKRISEAQYDAVLPFENGIARVKKADNWGVVNSKGIEVIKPMLVSIEQHFAILIAEDKNAKFGVCDNKGNILIPFEYEEIRWVKDLSAFELLNDGKMGWYNLNSHKIVWSEH